MKNINNVQVYGINESIKGSKYPMSTDISTLTDKITPTVIKLAQSKKGEGHDQWTTGIIVQFDLTFTIKAWTEAERYHFFDFISSQSTMHRITKFDLDSAYDSHVDDRIIKIMKDLVDEYNTLDYGLQPQDVEYQKKRAEQKKELYLKILYSNPCGFKLTARMTTNYRQLKTIYSQRRNHRLPEWQEFCDWAESLPYFKELFIEN